MPDPPAPGCSADESALQAEIVRLNKMVTALMNRAERSTSAQRSDFSLFQTAVMLEDQVRDRTKELEAALHENEKINRALHHVKAQMEVEIEQRKRAHEALEKERDQAEQAKREMLLA